MEIPIGSFYCVIKDTGYDFWVLREGATVKVYNAGVIADKLPECMETLRYTGKPPEWCEYLTLGDLPAIFNPMFNCQQSRTADELFGLLMYRMEVQVTNSTIPFTVRVPVRNYWDFVAKKNSMKNVCDGGCDRVARNSSKPLYVSCCSRQCSLTFCRFCICIDWENGRRCPCGDQRTFDWWNQYGFVRPYIKVELTGSYEPLSLAVIAAGCVRRTVNVQELTELHVPRETLSFLRTEGTLIDYVTAPICKESE